ncbi:transglycosylase domain-containing protein [Microbacterium sp. CFBP9034]|uniref:transglycosylase domain-containing protein n=1 Tax=Microbacterium sp. CFBP9034 TaxID=3096540 RepID=UPI002A6B5D2F|nr:transglycosylase domain-containing protein [Microbacterium sp. CFBP9034]MDY0910755.1 transglycosylase domain-containing protein [Microbacterium sp. CFBP9034]
MPDKNRTASGVLGGLAGLVGLSAVAGVLVAATVTPAIAVSGAAATSAITMFDNLPSVLEIDKLMLPTTLWVKNAPTDEEYVEMTQFYDQNRSPVEYNEIAPVMYDAILSSEDPRYYQHGGVDLIGTTRAVLSNLRGGGETQGGSTISQQYVKNILVQRCEAKAQTEEEKLDCWTQATTAVGDEGIERKLQEMRYAIALEQKYDKETILLGYLNIANFGGTTYGIDAAAKYYFGVSAKDLNLAQAATLAGIVQNPNSYRIDKTDGSWSDADGVTYNKAADQSVEDVNPKQIQALTSLLDAGTITQEQYVAAADAYSSTKGRQLYVLSRLLDDKKITQEQYDAAVLQPITPNITRPKAGCAGAVGLEYFCQYVRYVIERDPAFGATPEERTETLRRGGLNIYTTVDLRMQYEAQTTMNEVAPTSVPGGRFGAAAVSIEATTGRILAIAQNTKFSESITDDPNYSSIVYAGNRQFGQSDGFNAGSTFKLFTLVDWLEKGHSVNEVVNGRDRIIKEYPDSCYNNPAYYNTTYSPKNFNNQSGFVGTPMQFTKQSLNTGFMGMASLLDLCNIGKAATKMGVTLGTGEEIVMIGPNQVIGSDAVSPLAMAGAYATVANNGIYCQPQAIDRVTDSDGNEIKKPDRTCKPVLDPAVAATAAYALAGVMNGGTGQPGNPNDGTPLLGKTGTHEETQTWMIESSTTVTTAAWVGNADGAITLRNAWHNGRALNTLRYALAYDIQKFANQLYPGGQFPAPDSNLSRQVFTDLPDVVGKSVEEATTILSNAGFEVIVGAPVDSDQPTGIVAAQSPQAGKVAGGTPITISPSNGQGLTVPDVSGRSLDRAISELRQAGFGNVQPGTCNESKGADRRGEATATQPAAGTVTNRNTAITVDYAAPDCGNGGGNDGGDDD